MKTMNTFSAIVLAGMLTGCATTSNHPQDPFEGLNRAVFNFNDGFDKVILKPTAQLYQTALPNVVQTGVSNFFNNIGDVWTGVNNILQGKVGDGLSDFMRVGVNTVFGVGGLFDVGSDAGIPKHKEDFGQTLGRWGIKPGPYVVLPLLGSSTMRDTIALPVDIKGDLWQYKQPVRWRNTGTALRLIDQRAAALDATNLVEDAALDKYEFIRDAYLQRRENKVHDGETPSEPKAKPEKGAAAEPDEGSAAKQSQSGMAEPPARSAVKPESGPGDQPGASSVPLPQSDATKQQMPADSSSSASSMSSDAAARQLAVKE